MGSKQDNPFPYVRASTPTSSFSSVSSAASATSAATSRSGGSRLLFGEIDTSSERSSESYASVCSFVLCDSGIFLKFWLDDQCRDTLLACLSKEDLASLRLACHDFSVRAAPALFSNLSITFRSNTFTKPARLAALDRLGFYVKTLRFNFPHGPETFLPPLIEPETGAELSFTYSPQLQASRVPKYGDVGTTEILSRQYPALFHAATNVPAFIRAFSAFVNLNRLSISCPDYDTSTNHRRSVVDYALISLRIAVEQNNLNALNALEISPIHPGGLLYLSSLLGFGATPRSAKRWSAIQHLVIHMQASSQSHEAGEPYCLKLLQTYLRNFQTNLSSFHFRWIGDKGPLPLQRPAVAAPPMGHHPAHRPTTSDTERPRSRRTALQPLQFPKLQRLHIENIKTPAHEIRSFVETHKHTLADLCLEDVHFVSGTWDDALSPLLKQARPRRSVESAVIPIMLSPSTIQPLPAALDRVEVVSEDCVRRSLRASRWLSSKRYNPARKVREGLAGCEEQLKKMLRGSVLPWK